eukprot:273804-Amphidinium_carterae.5
MQADQCLYFTESSHGAENVQHAESCHNVSGLDTDEFRVPLVVLNRPMKPHGFPTYSSAPDSSERVMVVVAPCRES